MVVVMVMVVAVAFTVDIITVDITAVITSVGITSAIITIVTTTAGSTAPGTTAAATVLDMPLTIPAIASSTPKSVRAASTPASNFYPAKALQPIGWGAWRMTGWHGPDTNFENNPMQR